MPTDKPKRKVIRVGTRVTLKGCKTVATVIHRMSDVPGGVVLDKYLQGFRCWNIEDLERANAD